MATYRVYAKRSTIARYVVEANSAEEAEAMARKHLDASYYLTDSTIDENGDEQESPFTFIDEDGSQEDFISAEEDN